jgi:hypothetical protein
MPSVSCLCGQNRITIDDRPQFIHECNCSLCSKTGARWAYFDPSKVSAEGVSNSFRRADKKQANADVHFCPTCGCTTHFVLTETAIAAFGNSVMGVNMGLADPAELAGIELRYPDGRAWPGQGDFAYVREPRILP